MNKQDVPHQSESDNFTSFLSSADAELKDQIIALNHKDIHPNSHISKLILNEIKQSKHPTKPNPANSAFWARKLIAKGYIIAGSQFLHLSTRHAHNYSEPLTVFNNALTLIEDIRNDETNSFKPFSEMSKDEMSKIDAILHAISSEALKAYPNDKNLALRQIQTLMENKKFEQAENIITNAYKSICDKKYTSLFYGAAQNLSLEQGTLKGERTTHASQRTIPDQLNLYLKAKCKFLNNATESAANDLSDLVLPDNQAKKNKRLPSYIGLYMNAVRHNPQHRLRAKSRMNEDQFRHACKLQESWASNRTRMEFRDFFLPKPKPEKIRIDRPLDLDI